MGRIVIKKEVEEILEFAITDRQFDEALRHAERKQHYIFRREKRLEVMKRRYLVRLTAEYAGSLAFSRLTMDLCIALADMEKERPAKSRNTPTDTHIVQESVI